MVAHTCGCQSTGGGEAGELQVPGSDTQGDPACKTQMGLERCSADKGAQLFLQMTWVQFPPPMLGGSQLPVRPVPGFLIPFSASTGFCMLTVHINTHRLTHILL